MKAIVGGVAAAATLARCRKPCTAPFDAQSRRPVPQMPKPLYMASLSTLSLRARIFEFRSEASLEVKETAMTGRDTPQARPIATLLGRKTYGTFFSSARRGRWRTILSGWVSAARMISSLVPRETLQSCQSWRCAGCVGGQTYDLVASLAPFLSCL